VGLDARQQLELAVRQVALRLRAVASLGAQLLDALLDDRQVCDGELEVQVVDVAPRVG
jgi:hypothetical protein